MRGLVVDSALGALSVVAFDAASVLARRHAEMAKGHQERLGGFARDVAAETPDGWAGLERIVVTVGPGSFTGLRVGLAFALGLGAALDRPVLGVTTLHALAASAPEEGDVAVAVDARRGELYLQPFRDGRPLSEPAAWRIGEVAQSFADMDFRPRRLVGSGAPLLADLLPEAEVMALAAPSPEGLAAAARQARTPAAPLYLRAPDATPPTRRPGQTRPGRT